MVRRWADLLLIVIAGTLGPVAAPAATGADSSSVTWQLPDARIQRRANPVPVEGRTQPDAALIVVATDVAGRSLQEWRVQADDAGAFEVSLDRGRLPTGQWVQLSAQPAALRDAPSAPPLRVFVHPLVTEDSTLPSVTSAGRQLLVEGRPWGFAGLNYTRFLIEFSIRTNFERMVEDVRTQADWGVTVMRVPLHLGMIQPAPGIFPDHPEYQDVLRRHRLDVAFYELFEYFVAVCGHYGIRLVLDWHELPTDPWRYFVGGNHHDKGTGRPGQGIAWLYDQSNDRAIEPGDPRFEAALVSTNRWIARRFRGNGTFLGFEAPYNEPHSVTDSSDSDWRRLTAAATWAFKREDPDRLVFGMPPAWGHNNVLPSVTWQLPDLLTGMAPHYYLGNGPVPARADAPQRQEPWLARDVVATFAHSFAAVALPHTGAPYPVWNGESGEHGYDSLFPDLDRPTAASYMIEAQLVQAYAAGMVGSLGWTLTGHGTVYEPMTELYRAAYQRFSPVFTAGAVDYATAPVLFVQNPGAVPVDNGLNHAGVPFARLALDLHLGPVHYLTDDQLLSNGLVQISVGLEQVEEVASSLNYRAAIVDTRNIDARALALLEASGLPVLRTDEPARLSPDALTRFLEGAGIAVDRRTPPELQLIKGPRHLLVYRRAGDSGAARIYPRLPGYGVVTLVDERGGVAFQGEADVLTRDGILVEVPKWRTIIFTVNR